MVLQKNITPLISVLNCSFLSEKWTTLPNLLVSGYIFCVGRATLAEPAESGGARGQMPHSTKRAYTSWSPQKFWTFLRQCLAPHALQLGLQNEFAEWNLSIKGNYICREQQLLRPRKQYFCCELIRFIQAFRFDLMLPVLKHSKRAKNSQIFQKCAKCTLTLMSDYEIDF